MGFWGSALAVVIRLPPKKSQAVQRTPSQGFSPLFQGKVKLMTELSQLSTPETMERGKIR